MHDANEEKNLNKITTAHIVKQQHRQPTLTQSSLDSVYLTRTVVCFAIFFSSHLRIFHIFFHTYFSPYTRARKKVWTLDQNKATKFWKTKHKWSWDLYVSFLFRIRKLIFDDTDLNDFRCRILWPMNQFEAGKFIYVASAFGNWCAIHIWEFRWKVCFVDGTLLYHIAFVSFGAFGGCRILAHCMSVYPLIHTCAQFIAYDTRTMCTMCMMWTIVKVSAPTLLPLLCK